MFNETSYSTRFGALGDYVHGGDKLGYTASVNTSGDPLHLLPTGQALGDQAKIAAVHAGIQSNGFTIDKEEIIASAGSLAYNVTAPGDFADSNDVKALFDGIVMSTGLQLRGSQIQHQAMNLASGKNLDSGPTSIIDLSSAADWWGQGISSVSNDLFGGLKQALNIDDNVLMLGALAVGALILYGAMKR